jgi:hypothetical protein
MRLRSFPGALKRVLARLAGRGRRAEEVSALDPALNSMAASAIREYAEAHAALFERARRLGEKAERLARSGTPSESATNRAKRARREVAAGLAALRASFVESSEESEGGRAFDLEVERQYPAFALPDGNL